MADNWSGERTEKPTAKRREKARDEGNVARSRELNSVVIMMAGIMMLYSSASRLIGQLSDVTTATYSQLSTIELTPTVFPLQIRMVFTFFITVLGPFLAGLIIVGLLVNYMQVGFAISKKALKLKWKKLNPASGIKRIFSLMSVVELIKGLFKIIIVGFIALSVINKYLPDFWFLSNATTGQALAFLGSVLFELSLKTSGVLLIMALGDYAYQRWEHEKQLKMTKEEVKEEGKQYEGNPEIKRRIRTIQMQMSRSRMMEAVPDATVVVTNPTFIAVALKYDPVDRSDAPVVIAKGKRKVAEKIKTIAKEHQVPVIENKPLARGLFDTVEVGMEVPVLYYQAVAEILALVFQSQNKASLAGSYAR
ncbi:MAG: flagellar biosynthesis protein FlhB [Fidelibacterota bacterium]